MKKIKIISISLLYILFFSSISYSENANIGILANNIVQSEVGNGFFETGGLATFTILSKRGLIAKNNPNGLQNIVNGYSAGYQDITNYFELDNHYGHVGSMNIVDQYNELNNYLKAVYSSDVIETYQIGSDIVDAVPSIINNTPYSSVGSIFSLITKPFNLDPAATRILGAGFDLSGVGWVALMTDYALNYSFNLVEQQNLNPVAEFDVSILVPNEVPSPSDLKISIGISRDDLFAYDGTEFSYLKLPEIKNIRVYVSAPNECKSYGYQNIANIKTWYYKEYASHTSFSYDQYIKRYDGGIEDGSIWLPADKFVEITLNEAVPFRCPGEYTIFVYGDLWWNGQVQEEQKILAYTTVNVGGHTLDNYEFSEVEGRQTDLFNLSVIENGVLNFNEFWDRVDWKLLKVEANENVINSSLVSSGTGEIVTGNFQNNEEYLLIGFAEKEYSRIFPWPESSTLKARYEFHFKVKNNIVYTEVRQEDDIIQYYFVDPLSRSEATVFFENSSSDCYECNGILNIDHYSTTKNVISMNDGCTEINFGDDLWMSPITWLIYDNSSQNLAVSFNKIGHSFLSQYFKIFSNNNDSFTINGFGQDANKYWYIYGNNNIFNIGDLEEANQQNISNLTGRLINQGNLQNIYISGYFDGQIENFRDVYVSGDINEFRTSRVDNVYLKADFENKTFDIDSKLHLDTNYSFRDNYFKCSLDNQLSISSYHDDYAFTGFETSGISSHYFYENILYDGENFWLYKDYVSNDCLNRMNNSFNYTLGSGSKCGRDIVNQIGGSYTNGGDIAAFGTKKYIIANNKIYEYNYDYSNQIGFYDMSGYELTAFDFDNNNAYILEGSLNKIIKFDLAFNHIDSKFINLPDSVFCRDLVYSKVENCWFVYASNGYLYKLNSSFDLYPVYENKYYVGTGFHRFAARGDKIYGLHGSYDSYIKEFNIDFVKTNSNGSVSLNTFDFSSPVSIAINNGFPDILHLYDIYSNVKVGNTWIDQETGDDLYVCNSTLNSININNVAYRVCNEPVKVWSNGETSIYDYIIVNNFVNNPPAIVVPDDITVGAHSSFGTSVDNFEIQNFLNSVVANDNEDGSIGKIINNAPSVFPIGKTEVIFAVTDSDNYTVTEKASVYVVDQSAPIISIHSHFQIFAVDHDGTPSSHEQIVNFLASASANDNVDGSISIIHNNAPSIFPLGTTVVTFSATDSAGNTSTVQSSVTVLDKTPPTVFAPMSIDVAALSSVGVEASDESISAFLSAASAEDNVDGSLGSVSNDAPLIFPLGRTMVTFSATDSAGNTGSSQASVTVLDLTPPVVTPPANISVSAVSPEGVLSSDDTIAQFLAGATATDNVDGTILVVTHNAPSVFPIGSTQVLFSATDSAGNTGTCVGVVTVKGATEEMQHVPILHLLLGE